VIKEGSGKDLSQSRVGNGRPSAWQVKTFRTHDPDEALAYLSRDTYHVVSRIVLDRRSAFAFSRTELDLGRLRIIQAKSTSLQMNFTPSLLSLTVSERGQSLIKYRGTEVASARGDAAIVGYGRSPESSTLDIPSGSSRYGVALEPNEILNQFPADERLAQKIGQPFRLDLSDPLGANYHRALNFIRHQPTPQNELVRAAYDEILLHGIVSIFARYLTGDTPPERYDPAPSHIRRACEMIRARVSEPIRIADIAAELGISARHLQAGFRRHLGSTPHQFLRNCRLEEARRMLSAALPGQNATTIAYDCGFGHLSDFAHDYRNRFGESPSETLRRAKHL
jgi:AraC-like DNA-binding protein